MWAAGSHEMTRAPSGKLDHARSMLLHGRQQVAVGELDALRRPGGARRVDQRQQVLGLDRAPCASTSKPGSAPSTSSTRRRALGAVAVDHDDVLELGQLLARLRTCSR